VALLRHRTPLPWLALTVALAGGAPRAAAQPVAAEYEVKAAFLFNFAKFVEWPPEAFAQTDDTLVIGVVGTDPFGPTLDRLVENKQVHGKRLVARRFADANSITSCQILFVSASESTRAGPVLETAKARFMLTVGETDDFLDQGGMISLRLAENRVRFEVNSTAAEEARLRISSQLLKLAVRVVSGS
jgi:hypothetical protein